VLTGAASGCDPSVPPKGCSGCGRRHPSHPSMTSWLFTPRPEHQQHDACWTRGEPQCSGSMELSAGRLAQHSMHLVDSESCLPFDVPTTWPRSVPSKVAPRSDDEVTTRAGKGGQYVRPLPTKCVARAWRFGVSDWGGPEHTEPLAYMLGDCHST
jgi:hypothetical protein